MTRIANAILSVHDKSGLVEFATGLHRLGIALISTGGTARELRQAGLPTVEVAELTGSGELLGGRVKTLHPAVYAGILARRGQAGDMLTLQERGIRPIDLVVVNLYPFIEKTAEPIPLDEALEEIDIGGVTLIRAAAKNFPDVAVVTDPADYPALLQELSDGQGRLAAGTRLHLARKAFALTARYDQHIARYLDRVQASGEVPAAPAPAPVLPDTMSLSFRKLRDLRYGENPHQRAALYVFEERPRGGWAAASQLHGKELSYNNFLDMDAAWQLVSEFADPACAIIKHTNPCGLALGRSGSAEAFRRALACDPISAFGSVIAFNRPVTPECAQELSRLFVEVLIAPEFDPEARQWLQRKRDLRLVRRGPETGPDPWRCRSIDGATLVQEPDRPALAAADLKPVTLLRPDPAQTDDLLFAWKCVKHVKSNAIVVARDGQVLGIGAGQTSRVDSARIALGKGVFPTAGAVLASDAFIPFRDTVDLAAAAGIAAIIQTGGSVRDAEVIAAANEARIAMVLTGQRHFCH